MSKAADVFALAILDAENLLGHFNTLNPNPPTPELEVLKRAGLIMAMTAWETYVEDRVQEASETRLAGLQDSSIVTFVRGKLDDEIKRLHNPTSDKTIQLFRDYADIDLTLKWSWNNFEPKLVRERLNHYMKLRGDVVHRSRAAGVDISIAHPVKVKKEDIEKAISFLRELVKATEASLTQE